MGRKEHYSLTTIVFLSAVTATCGLAQNNVVRWSTFDMGFGFPSASPWGIASAVGQPFVGQTRTGDSMVESGFLVDILFRGPLTAVSEGGGSSIPTSYELSQNYPNPFNPSTTIRYALPRASNVSVIVYNALGQQVAIIVNEQQEAGYHDVVFAGTNLASGVYFYRLSVSPLTTRDLVQSGGQDEQPGGFVSVKKFILVK